MAIFAASGVSMKRNKTSRAWVQEHVNDHYVQRAKADGYRSRAAYKLLEIDTKDRLFHAGQRVVDLGSAPGGWSQVAVERVKPGGKVLAIDLLPMQPVPGCLFIQGDFRDAAARQALSKHLNGHVDLVITDLSPNLTGITDVDQARWRELADLSMAFAQEHLAPTGTFLIKVFQGDEAAEYREQLQQQFSRVEVRKPKASRDRSTEFYLLARRPLQAV